MTRIHAGALLTRPPGQKYLAELDFAELDLPEPLPTARTLRRWREQMPDELELGLIAPRAACRSDKGPLRFDDAMRTAFERTQEAASILRARFVILTTGADVTTGRRDRNLLAEWVEPWDESHAIVWQPRGLWDPELAIPFAKKLGVLYGFDPLEGDAVPTGPLVYARLAAVGARKRFDETRLLDIVDAVEQTGAEEAFVALDSPASFREATRLCAVAS